MVSASRGAARVARARDVALGARGTRYRRGARAWRRVADGRRRRRTPWRQPASTLAHGQGACAHRRVRAPRRAAAAARRLGRRGRARGARGDAREALDQARVEAPGARSRDPDDGPDDARGPGHAREGRGALLEGDAPRPGRPDACRRSPRSASTRTSSRPRRSASRAAASRSRRSRRRSRPASRRPSSRSPRRARSSSSAPTRSTWSSTAARSSRAGTRRSTTRSSAVKEACGDAHLKVILETGELGTYDNVRRASLLAIAAGADFIKTSTGKISPAATLPGDALHDGGRPRRATPRPGAWSGSSRPAGSGPSKQAVQYLVVALRDARPASG